MSKGFKTELAGWIVAIFFATLGFLFVWYALLPLYTLAENPAWVLKLVLALVVIGAATAIQAVCSILWQLANFAYRQLKPRGQLPTMNQ